MSAIDAVIGELVADLERAKIRISRLERAQTILVISGDDLASMAKKSGRSHSECISAIRETDGDMTAALSDLTTIRKDG
jgi:NACalpha-BTF3-like transcription factor